MFYEEVFRKLREKGVRYAVVGGVALVLHGVVRLTADLDLIVDLRTDNLRSFIPAMKELGYKPKPPVRAEDFIEPEHRRALKDEKGMMVFTFYHPEKPINLVDVFVDEPIRFDDIAKEMVMVKAKDIAIPVVSKTHLKILKRMAGRPQDLADVEALEELERMEEKSEG